MCKLIHTTQRRTDLHLSSTFHTYFVAGKLRNSLAANTAPYNGARSVCLRFHGYVDFLERCRTHGAFTFWTFDLWSHSPRVGADVQVVRLYVEGSAVRETTEVL